jgi:hypothetical protein
MVKVTLNLHWGHDLGGRQGAGEGKGGGGGEGGKTNLDGAVENAIEANLRKGGDTGVHAREEA